MEYRRLGQAGVKVSPICLGAGVRGELDEERFIRTIEYAIDLGCNFIDCANNYGKRQSEILLGQAIAQTIELLWTADRLGLEPIACLQNHYNLLRRWEVEPDLLTVCRRYGLGLMTYSPLAIGLLSGRFRRGATPPADTFWEPERLQTALSERADRVIQTLVDLAAERGTTPARLAIAWLLDHDEVTAPIVGADRPEYVEDVFGAQAIELTRQERQALDAVSQWEAPGEYL